MSTANLFIRVLDNVHALFSLYATIRNGTVTATIPAGYSMVDRMGPLSPLRWNLCWSVLRGLDRVGKKKKGKLPAWLSGDDAWRTAAVTYTLRCGACLRGFRWNDY